MWESVLTPKQGDVNAIQKCHRLRKPEMSPRALMRARLSIPEIQDIAGLVSIAGVVILRREMWLPLPASLLSGQL
jgi:hypothetical protein